MYRYQNFKRICAIHRDMIIDTRSFCKYRHYNCICLIFKLSDRKIYISDYEMPGK